MATSEGFTLNGWQRATMLIAGAVLGLFVTDGISSDGVSLAAILGFVSAVGMIVGGFSGLARTSPNPVASRKRWVLTSSVGVLILLAVAQSAWILHAQSRYAELQLSYFKVYGERLRLADELLVFMRLDRTGLYAGRIKELEQTLAYDRIADEMIGPNRKRRKK